MLEEVVVTAARESKSDYDSPSNAAPVTPSFDEVKYEADLFVDFKIEAE
ncbi:hypothetical protein [Microbulbifer pacificus]|nr:hypothetical protein [Microbulbifer pacificus]